MTQTTSTNQSKSRTRIMALVSSTNPKYTSKTRVRHRSVYGIIIVGIAFTLVLSISIYKRSVRLLEVSSPIQLAREQFITEMKSPNTKNHNQGSSTLLSIIGTHVHNNYNKGNHTLAVTSQNYRYTKSGRFQQHDLIEMTNKNNAKLYEYWYGC